MEVISQIRIRLAENLDDEAIASLLFESFAEYESLYAAEGFSATAITAEQTANRIAEGPVWVALLGDKIVGTVSVLPKGDSLYLRGMAVLPATRGQRIGELLLAHVEQFAARENFQR